MDPKKATKADLYEEYQSVLKAMHEFMDENAALVAERDALRAENERLRSTSLAEGWQLVPSDLVSVLREVVDLHQKKGLVLRVNVDEIERQLGLIDAPAPEDT